MNTPQFCKVLDKKGAAISVSLRQASQELSRPVWIHIDYKDVNKLKWLRSLNLDATVLENLLDADTSPRCFVHEKGLVMVMRGVCPNRQKDDDMVALHVWMTKNRLLTVSHRSISAIDQVLGTLQQRQGPKTIGDCLTQLCASMVHQMEESLALIDDKVDELEEAVIEEKAIHQDRALRSDISHIRHVIVGLRRYILPQREMMKTLTQTSLPFFSKANRVVFGEMLRDLITIVEGLEFARDHSKVTQEELDSKTNINISRTMYLMSLIMVIFTPLSFITGLLGANIGGIPFNDDPAGFGVICAILICIVVFQVIFIKKMRWF